MKDWLFYPLILLIALGGIYFALSFGEGRTPVDPAQGLYVAGSDLALLTAAPGTSFTVSADGSTAYATLSAHISRDLAPPSAGVFAILTQEHLNYMQGKPIRVSIVAKSGEKKPNKQFEIAFLISDTGRVNWTERKLGDAYRSYEIETTISSGAAKKIGVGYIGIWPDTDGLGRTVDVREITVKIVSPDPAL